MSTIEEALEAAYKRFSRELDQPFFSAGWDARGHYDEKRIAALVEALVEVRQHARVALESGFSFNRGIITIVDGILGAEDEEGK